MDLKTLVVLVCCCATLGQAQQDGFRRRVVGRAGKCDNVERAENGDTVSIKYSGKLASDGKIFDSNLDGEPITYELGKGRVIQGWETGLLGTCEGEQLELEIPPELGYGQEDTGNGLIPPNSKLIFTLTLVKLEKNLKIETLKKGDCSRDQVVRQRDKVHLHYIAKFVDGNEFDNSYDRDTPLVLPVGESGIKGWDEGVKGACPGEIRRVTVPAHLGYGEKGIEGTVPPNTTIVLEMEIIRIEDRVVSFLERISSGTFRGRK
jgi:FKBP-type peptidyl-prolyl cis-trans isomerase